MNNFSFKRLGMLYRAELLINRRSLLIKLGSITAALVVVYTIFAINIIRGNDHANSMMITARIVAIMIGGFGLTYMTSISFSSYFSRQRGISALTLPTTQCEKFAFAWINSLIIYPLVLAIVFVINDIVWCSILSTKLLLVNTLTLPKIEGATINNILLFIGSVLAMHSFYFMGAVFFRRNQLGYTIITQVVLSMIYGFFAVKILIKMDPNTTAVFMSSTYIAPIYLASALALWSWAWFRFRAIQINK